MKSRQSNFELLRIICMILIIFFHLVTQTSLEQMSIKQNGLMYFYFLILGSAGRIVCNTFVMIGAWFLVDLSFKAERIVNLWLEIFFYAVIITLLTFAFGWKQFSIILLIQSAFPIFGRPVWFGAEYICLLILTPWLNRMFERKNVILTKKLLFVFGVLIIGAATLFPIEHTSPAFSELTWFIFLYLFIGLYKKGDFPEIQWIEKWRWCVLIVSYCSIICLQIMGNFFSSRLISEVGNYYRGHYESLVAFLCSFSVFLVFKNFKYNENKVINWFSESTFAVYIIHQIPAFYPYMWNGIFHIDQKVGSEDFFSYSFNVVMCIFFFCTLIDYFRRLLFRRFLFTSNIYLLINEKINSWFDI